MPTIASLLSLERPPDAPDVALVTLRRPEKRNALSIELRVELMEAFISLGDDEGVGAIVLTGAGPAFCSGMDVSQFGGDAEHKRQLVDSSIGSFSAVGNCPKPVISAVNGPALAGGFALALLSDIRLASESATFGFPELPRGIPPSYASARAALPANIAAELTLTGRILDADAAVRAGIVSSVHDAGDLMPRALELAGRIAAGPRGALAETKKRILLDRERNFGHLFAEEERAFREALLGEEPDPAA